MNRSPLKLCSVKWHYNTILSAKRHGDVIQIYQAMRFAIDDRGFREAYAIAGRVEEVHKLKRTLKMHWPLETRLKLYKAGFRRGHKPDTPWTVFDS
ncbi:hypothetical protein [Aliivibrio fischeri]|uniref:hypothetical protein n=1 Tax=Aliivibrio fischeri TaxID=668 RepID=UPI00080E20F0|nr:hypothetical protein [Aliivibrio fischeri]OCH43687.1 hypothetical protein A6E02_11355 [Aliivibrio fischeri]OED52868.1 hypothetical protein BEI47_18600 [Aliivibrio fischeri]